MATKNTSKSVINNADEIIERFGGIRPMAKKMDVAVTTIQGWKKRDRIPASRRKQLLKAAEQNNIDVSDLMGPANTASKSVKEPIKDKQKPASVPSSQPDEADSVEDLQEVTEESYEGNDAKDLSHASNEYVPPLSSHSAELKNDTRNQNINEDILQEKLVKTEKKAVIKSLWMTVVLVLLAVFLMMFILFPAVNPKDRLDSHEARIEGVEKNVLELQGEVDDLQNRQSFFSTIIPEDLDERINNIQKQAQETQEDFNAAIKMIENKAAVISNDVLSENAGSLETRLKNLETHMRELGRAPEIDIFLQRIRRMKETAQGQETLGQAIREINTVVGQTASVAEEQINPVLNNIRTKSTAVGQTLEGVPQTELKAAALLMGMTQMRDSLNRDNTPFDEDLELLLNLIGNENPELRGMVKDLAPKAESGVLTPKGLTDEFRALTGDAITASLSGEDVSIKEKFKAKFSTMLSVEKDGELVNGTPTQNTLDRVDALLEKGDLEAAIAEVQTLNSEASEVMQPWLEEAQDTLSAQRTADLLNQKLQLLETGMSADQSTASEGEETL